MKWQANRSTYKVLWSQLQTYVTYEDLRRPTSLHRSRGTYVAEHFSWCRKELWGYLVTVYGCFSSSTKIIASILRPSTTDTGVSYCRWTRMHYTSQRFDHGFLRQKRSIIIITKRNEKSRRPGYIPWRLAKVSLSFVSLSNSCLSAHAWRS